jgi:hypothetical protein
MIPVTAWLKLWNHGENKNKTAFRPAVGLKDSRQRIYISLRRPGHPSLPCPVHLLH